MLLFVSAVGVSDEEASELASELELTSELLLLSVLDSEDELSSLLEEEAASELLLLLSELLLLASALVLELRVVVELELAELDVPEEASLLEKRWPTT